MKKFLFLLLAVMVLAAYGCGGGGTDTVEVPGETVTVTTPGDIITVNNNIPVANAGADQTSAVGNIVSLDGTGSSDADGDAFTCKWTIVSVPSGSSLNALGDAATAAPYFGVDVAGNYTLQLIVNDGKADSQPDTVMISVNSLVISNVSPADGATDVSTSSKLSWEFNGTSSPKYDVYFGTFSPPPLVSYQQTGKDYDPGILSLGTTYYRKVIGSNYYGTYQDEDSGSFTTTTTDQPPIANAGVDQTSAVGNIVLLDGTGSYDSEGGALTYKWTIVSVPSGSSLNALGDAATAAPYFGVDVAGNYTLQLIVNDGKADSQPDTVMISVNSLVISNVSPADGATDVSTSSKLSWEFNGTSSPKYDVYFGTSASPALVSSQQAGTSYDPGTLSSGQTYYWQVIGSNYGGAYSAPSSLMSFTTATTGGVPTCTTGTDITLCSNGVMTVANARSHFDSGGQSYYDAGATADVAGSFNSWLGGNSSAVVSSGGSWTISLTSMALAEGNNRLTPILTSSGLIVTWMSMSTFGSVDQSTFFGQAPNGDWSMKVKKTGSSYSTVPSGEILPQSPRWYRNKIKK